MNRTEREVTSREEILDILSRCPVIRLGFQGEPYPYVVPVCFGMEVVGELPVLYFHCARRGLKLELLRANSHVCVEGDIFIKTEPISHGITARYESVIGFGTCELLEEPEEILKGLRLLNQKYGYNDYPLDRCRGLEAVQAAKITVEAITGKRNLPRADG
ncbi:MAG: pyridoxamine 5'-phosphate oxidase family protein [Oscillospiraceae bacterium]|nr:pyridoxamine 5'-phosphate oxidase family protein [Oscillospiraceae bacterium]